MKEEVWWYVMDWSEVKHEYETTDATLKSLAERYDVKPSTLRSRKNREHWQRETKKVATRRNDVATPAVEQLEANNDLTEKQKLLCLFYLQRFNATWVYIEAYDAKHDIVLANGSRLLSNARVKQQLAELKKQQSADLYFDIQDIINVLRQISKADARDVVDFKTVKRLL